MDSDTILDKVLISGPDVEFVVFDLCVVIISIIDELSEEISDLVLFSSSVTTSD